MALEVARRPWALRMLRDRAGNFLDAHHRALANPALRRLLLAWGIFMTSGWVLMVVLALFAYQVGRVEAVGVLWVARILPAALVAPFVELAANRENRKLILVGGSVASAAATAAIALTIAMGGPLTWVYILVTVLAVPATLFRPVLAALLPSLAGSAEELTAANATASTLEGIGTLIGTGLAGFLVAITSITAVVTLAALAQLACGIAIAGILLEANLADRPPPLHLPALREVLMGLRAIATTERIRLMVAVIVGQTLARGLLNVLTVVAAIELLGLGRSGVGVLYSVMGAASFVGGFATFTLLGRGRLGAAMAIGLTIYGLPLALIGIWPNPGVAISLFGVLGAANVLANAAATTLLQRSLGTVSLARAFGVLQALLLVAVAAGAIVAPRLVAWLGIRGALVVAGLFLPIVAGLLARGIAQGEGSWALPSRRLWLVRSLPMFNPLPPVAVEEIAATLKPLTVKPGARIINQGEAGDRFYIIDRGRVTVSMDGRTVRPLEAGDYFGEIALIRDVPRTASVTADTEVDMFTLDRDEFIAAVTGHPQSADAARSIVGIRLGTLATEIASA